MSDDRKKRIMKHLNLTGNVQLQRSPRNSQASTSVSKPKPAPTPEPKPVVVAPEVKIQPTTLDNRKQRIMQHISQSGTKFNFSSDAKQRKQKVQAHLNKTRG